MTDNPVKVSLIGRLPVSRRAWLVLWTLAWMTAQGFPLLAFAATRPAPPPAGVSGLPAYSLAFDASRDPEADLDTALRAALRARRNVLVVVGGDWCVWCFLLDRHFSMDARSAQTWYGAFEVLRVYYGDDNRNAAFLSRYPDFELFPHFFILDQDGRVLGSSTADVLIRDARYDNESIERFIGRWSRVSGAPARPDAAAP